MFWKSVATILALSVILTAQAESQEEVTVKEANIQIDVSKIEGKINRDVAGIMTDPPRPDWLKKHLASLSMAGGEKGAELHGDGANAFWLPVINPSFINLGWGGDTWYLFDTWPAEGTYNWDRLDAWIESHQKRGASNLSLVFSLIPQWLWSEDAPEDSRVALNFFPYLKRGHVLPPADYEKYEELIYQTVRHLNVEKKFGIKFTLWNEPNVRFWQGSMEQYLELCARTARAVKRADPNTIVGGPATAQLAPFWIRSLIEHFAKNDLPLDFISWHYYLFYAKKSGRVQSFLEQVNQINGIVEGFPQIGNPNLYITEWAYDWKASDVSPAFNGAFVAQSLYEMLEGGVDGATYCGNLGILEAPDPAAHAFMLFGQLEDQRIHATVMEEGSSIHTLASAGGDRVTFLVWDFPGYDKSGERVVSSVKVDVQNLENGAYRLRQFLVDGNHLDAERKPVMESTIHSNGQFTLDLKLDPFAVSLFELQRN